MSIGARPRPTAHRLVGAIAVGAALVFAPVAIARPAAAHEPASLRKLAGGLRELAAGRRAKRTLPSGATFSPGPLTITRGKVVVDVYVHGAMRRAAAALRGTGMRVTGVSGRPPERIVEGLLPVAALADAAALGSTQAIMPVTAGLTNAVTSQGDAAHHGPQARALAGVGGEGIPVGVMSDSINQAGGGVAGSQASGDLPANVQVLSEKAGGTDEGRAMAEIVYDTAPGIPKIVFAQGVGVSGMFGPVQRAANIDALVANGAKVIADDTFFLSEPFFQDGVVAQAVDRAKANGTAYFVSAGNRARQSWEGRFTPGSTGDENNFATSGPEDLRQTVVTVPPSGGRLTMVLQWDEPLGAATTDFAINVYKVSDEVTPYFPADFNDTTTTHIPTESFQYTNGTASAVTISIAIRRVAGTGTPRLKWIANTNFGAFTPLEHDTGSQAIDPDAASARGSLAVAAVQYNDPGLDTAESFSSRGPSVTRYLDKDGNRLATPDVRAKPDIAAADGVTTSFPAGGFNPFFGTSAAAPSAAGVGALLLSAKPSLPIDELYAILREPAHAVDCTSAAGFPDGDCGAGFILADGKIAQVLDSTSPAVAPMLSPVAPDGANGWYRSDVSLSWNVSDSESPVASTSNCEPASVTTDGIGTFTCTAMSAGGTTNQPVQVRRDASPPSTPLISGIQATMFFPDRLPAQSAVTCAAADPTSGVDSCVVSGFTATPGAHTLTATATNGAGLTSTATLVYTVVRPAAASALRVARKVKLARLLRSGLPFRLVVATDRTNVVANLLSRGTSAARTKVIGRLRSTRNRGAPHLTLKLSGAGKKALRGKRGAKLTLVVKASGPSAKAATLTANLAAAR